MEEILQELQDQRRVMTSLLQSVRSLAALVEQSTNMQIELLSRRVEFLEGVWRKG
mgnify:CR=1 FL=1